MGQMQLYNSSESNKLLGLFAIVLKTITLAVLATHESPVLLKERKIIIIVKTLVIATN